MAGKLEHVHVVRQRRGDPEPITVAELVPGRGVPGDHHDRPGIKRAVTMIAAETLEDVGGRLKRVVKAGSSRRNLTSRGIAIDSLAVGTLLKVGTAELEVKGPCDPCERMEKAIGPGALALMANRGGVVLRIVKAGRIAPGDTIKVVSAPVVDVAAERKAKTNALLLGWFRGAKRDLPWRRTTDPYGVWISEIMLQQTQVSTVIPYWERFLADFPDVQALAAAPLDDVLRHWSGLGYYARARNLHKAAQEVVERFGGKFPADLEALQTLPGFGRYTAGAVGSIALGLDAPLVDGNVARVLCRIEGQELGAEEALAHAWQLAPTLIPAGKAGDWNQALMELGATVCSPATPACDRCPARSICQAAASGDPAKYPLAKVRKPRKPLRVIALAVRRGEAVLMTRRERKGLFGGLWELPGLTVDAGADASEVAASLAKSMNLKGGVDRRAVVEATLTHRDVTVEVFVAQKDAGVATQAELRLVPFEELVTLGMSTLGARVLRAAGLPLPETHARRRAVRPDQPGLFKE